MIDAVEKRMALSSESSPSNLSLKRTHIYSAQRAEKNQEPIHATEDSKSVNKGQSTREGFPEEEVTRVWAGFCWREWER